jgi:hypothetical protein
LGRVGKGKSEKGIGEPENRGIGERGIVVLFSPVLPLSVSPVLLQAGTDSSMVAAILIMKIAFLEALRKTSGDP